MINISGSGPFNHCSLGNLLIKPTGDMLSLKRKATIGYGQMNLICCYPITLHRGIYLLLGGMKI